MKTPILSNILIQGFNAFVDVILFKLGLGKNTHLNNDEKAAYRYPAPNWSSRLPYLDCARQIPLSQHAEVIPLLTEIAEGFKKMSTLPVHIFWAPNDPGFKQYFEPTKELFPQAKISLFQNANHFLQEDVGSEIATQMVQWINGNSK